MKKLFLLIAVLCLWTMSATAVGVKTGSPKTLVDSCGFFPQLSNDGRCRDDSGQQGLSRL